MRKKELLKIKIGVSVLTVALVGAGIYYVYTDKVKQVEQSYGLVVSQAKEELLRNTKSGYVAKKNIKMGTALKEDMVILNSGIISDMPQEYFITENDFGKITTVAIKSGMPITTNCVSKELLKDVKERECGFIWLSSNLKEGDYADIRILFPNGEDYIVLAKKCLKNLNLSANNVFLWLNESDINTLSSALVDANLNGAKLYTTKYIKPSIQKASIETYDPDEVIIDLIKRNPNIIQESQRALSKIARNAMEKRLEQFEKDNPDFTLNENTLEHNSTGTESSTETPNTSTENSEKGPLADNEMEKNINSDGTLNGANGGYSNEGDFEYVE